MTPWPSSRFTSSNPTPNASSQPSHGPITRKPLPLRPVELPAGPSSPTRVTFLQNGITGQQQQQPRSSPTRPTTMGSDGHHSHNRSMSNPLPKLFGRKRSAPGLRDEGIDLPLDNGLVPVLEGTPTNPPGRIISGKKKDEDRDMKTRNCMCCDNKVRFPRELKVFRCTTCLTINDLEPYRPKPRGDGQRHGERRADTFPGNDPSTRVVPLSVERSKAIIDRCLMEYFEARCRRPTVASKTIPSDPFINGGSASAKKPSKQSAPVTEPRELVGSPIDLASAPIKDTPDFDWFPVSAPYDTAPSTSSPGPSPAPATPTPIPGAKATLPAPPLPDRRPPPPPDQPSPLPSRRGDVSVTPTTPAPSSHSADVAAAQASYERIKTIFRPLEDYMLATYGDYQCLNTSFSTWRPRVSARARSESSIRTPSLEPTGDTSPIPLDSLQNMDAKTLMIGDFAENGQWWTGRAQRKHSDRHDKSDKPTERKRLTTSKSPGINWDELGAFYQVVHTAGGKWWEKLDNLRAVDDASIQQHLKGPRNAREIDTELSEARQHVERTVLKITESLLKRPTRPLTEPDNIRFLMLILMNPSIYPDNVKARTRAPSAGRPGPNRVPTQPQGAFLTPPDGRFSTPPVRPNPTPISRDPMREPEQHTGIRKRVLGLMANSSETCHRYLIGWFSRLPDSRFVRIENLFASFVTYRLLRKRSRSHSSPMPQDGGLIPDLSGSMRNTSAQLRSATGLGGSVRVKDMETQDVVDYSEDWQLKAAARVMALLFAANNSWPQKKAGLTPAETSLTSIARPRAKTHGQLLPTSDFYNTLLDYHDLVADFKAWESKKAKFTFCQYPFFLSMGAKIRVLEYDARRQMELKAREAYFDSVTTHRAIDGYLHLRVRRDCMVDDSLQQISAAVGQGQEELKKGLKVHFTDEEGVDAGGLRKEWFLMLVRDIFDPNHGMFLYDDDSQTCYFNPNSFETSDQYYLVGALLGLAIYNSTILDVALPSFAFRKLLASAPASSSNPSLPSAGARTQMTYTIDDLAEYRPALAAGLRQLLEFDGDVQETFCLDFVVPVERYGVVIEVPLCSNGEARPVTNANRQEYVDLYVRYLLDGAVIRQFEPFKRGFFTVCAGNALSLFRPEEIELLVRGSDEALDVDSLRAVAVYENWRTEQPPHKALPNPAETVPAIGWFWDFFKKVTPEQQRLLLSFITGSDRIPAVGATSLVLKICCGGDGTGRGDAQGTNGVMNKDRFPIARTCFNMLVLWGYESREKLEEKLWRAVCESEGFGLK